MSEGIENAAAVIGAIVLLPLLSIAAIIVLITKDANGLSARFLRYWIDDKNYG